ncbi:sigma-54-dependent transcriptional regulator [Cerasicoccus arenae]|nr:sigma-54 dependent transcriptional regulator [Cerasicoccus arenae]MBK1857521.1 sigma-54-dependent Fis family transcriptional regulator [Cerasicoccus arenae]
MLHSLLIVDDEKHTRDGLMAAFEDDYEVSVARDAEEAFRLLDADEFTVVLTDLRMAGQSGLKVIDKAVKMAYHPIIIMMTAYGNVETAVEAMKRGAYDFVTKPLNLEKLEILIKRAIKTRKMEAENVELHQRLDRKFSFQGIIGNSAPLQQVLEEVKQVAPSKATVMIYGETGTGKELVAQMIHQNSPRSRGAFVPVHCAAIPANLLESELFGHEKGAFTGANERRIGRFEAADGGTLFLDEIGEIDAPTQVKLLRFLETRTVERLGSMKAIPVDVRLVCATNRDLRTEVEAGRFREDLYFRLSVVPLTLPPLRFRRDDIPMLLDHFIQQFAAENEMPPPKLAPSALKALQQFNWPGNIRELRNFCENAVVMKRGGEITEYDLDPRFLGSGEAAARATDGGATLAPKGSGNPPPLSKAESEKRLLRRALQESGGNRTKAAELMGISRRTLHRKLARWPELDTSS